MAGNNYREQMETMARVAIREKNKGIRSPETRLRSLFDQVSDLVSDTKQTGSIFYMRPDLSDTSLYFEGITVDMPDGDRIELGVEKRGWFNSRRSHGPRVLIGIAGGFEQPKGRGKFLQQQFMIEKMDAYTFLHYTHTLAKGWRRVEEWPKDPKNYVGFLENVYTAASRKILPGGPVTG